MKQLIKDLNLNLVNKLLSYSISGIKKDNHSFLPEYSEYKKVHLLEYNSLEADEIAICTKNNLISKYRNRLVDRNDYWLLDPDKIEVLKDLQLFFRMKELFKLAEEIENE